MRRFKTHDVPELEREWDKLRNKREERHMRQRRLAWAEDSVVETMPAFLFAAIMAGWMLVMTSLAASAFEVNLNILALTFVAIAILSLLAALLPIPVRAAIIATRIANTLELRKAANAARRNIEENSDLPLATLLWAVRVTETTPMPHGIEARDYMKMAERVARKVVKHHHSEDLALVRQVEHMPTVRANAFAEGWEGSSETFLQEGRKLGDDSWGILLQIVRMLPQAEERPQGWVNDLVETLGNAKLEEFHKEAIYKLAPEWDAPPAQLVATATLL